VTHNAHADDAAVAIVGMAGRFPGAPDVATFWRNVASGVESIDVFSDEALRAAGVAPELVDHPAYVKACGVCADEDLFDARYFGFSPREAQAMDPQQRVFLEGAVEALEHAGLDPDTFPGPIGVYAGVGVSTYQRLIEAHPSFVDLVGGLQVLIGTNKDHLTTHVSYRLNLTGPSVGVQTACSTSLVAVVHACQALLTFQCDAALAGGVSIAVPQREGYLYEVGGIDSPDGHCRAFDAMAAGTVGGNGMGIVVLKRLADARAAGDTIHAVIRGFAVNNDGANKVGYTAPSVEGQAEVIALAQAMAGVHPESISYIESHGTGTALGDPIEIAALTNAFRRHTARARFCAIGSVKTNIGHLDSAAGVAGLIKTVQALRHRQLPPSLHFTAPNPRIDFDASPFVVNTELRVWDAPWPRRAGVSSFGIGGTNAHVIVDEAPPREPSDEPARPVQLLTVSSRSAETLGRAIDRLHDHLEAHPEQSLADVAFTLHTGRRALEYRAAVVGRTHDEARQALRVARQAAASTSPVRRKDVPIAFVFPGQGSQQPGMARGFYDIEPAFRQAFDACADRLTPLIGLDLRDLCLGEPTAERAEALAETIVAQPALFSVQYAMARMWLAWGIRPDAFIGHSVGEYTAACLAGVFTLDDALDVIAARGRLMQDTPRGAMLAVPLGASALPSLPEDVDLAAVNGPDLVTLAGPDNAITRVAEDLRRDGVETTRLRASHAFHSRSLDGMLEAFGRVIAGVPRREPSIRYVSNVTGTWISPEDACSPEYYARQVRQTVRFGDGVQTLLAAGIEAFVELGPGRTLGSVIRRQIPAGSPAAVFATAGSAAPASAASAVECLGQLWKHGVRVDWRAFHEGVRRHRVELPTYPFERTRHWIDDEPADAVAIDETMRPARAVDAATRNYLPSWTRSRRLGSQRAAAETTDEPACWLLLADQSGLANRIAAHLNVSSSRLVVVESGTEFKHSGDRFTVRPTECADFERVLAALDADGLWPRRILHCWSLDAPVDGDVWTAQSSGAFSVLALTQALLQTGRSDPATVLVVTTSMLRVLHDDPVDPARATLLGPCRTVPQEAPFISCRVLDVARPAPCIWTDDIVREIAREADDATGGTILAYRGGYRWVQSFEEIDATSPVAPSITQGGTYVITGGLGRLGLRIAHWMASTTPVQLVLTSRTGLPDRSTWPAADDALLVDAQDETWTASIIAAVREIESLGSRVDVCELDVADTAAMQALWARLQAGGGVQGVVHCAGATGPEHFRPAALVTPELWREHFRPKVDGVLALSRAIAAQPPEFVVLMSSLSTVLGGLGFLPYAAANAFMDAFAEAEDRTGAARWISVGWDGWLLDDDLDDEDAMAAADDAPTDEEVYDEVNLPGALAPAEGLRALASILSDRPGPHVIVSAGDLQPRMREWIDLVSIRDGSADRASADNDAFDQGAATAVFEGPASDVERHVAGLWTQLLGVPAVTVDDNFFELGGHSLLAIQLTARLRERYRIDLTVDAVFAAPTVGQLAREVQRRQAAQEAPRADEIEALLAQVEAMDEAALNAILSGDERGAPGRPGEER
jgi:phthiocerol/phenolphthiocerol synthesis type-I polyketide synthase E